MARGPGISAKSALSERELLGKNTLCGNRLAPQPLPFIAAGSNVMTAMSAIILDRYDYIVSVLIVVVDIMMCTKVAHSRRLLLRE